MAAKKKAKRRAKNSPRHSDAKIIECLSVWLSTGSSREAAKRCKVVASTIRNWRERRPELWNAVLEEHEHRLRDLRASIAETTARGLQLGAERVHGTLKAGGELEPRDLSALMRALSDIDSTQDRIRRLDANQPTDRVVVEERSDREVVANLKRRLEALGLDTSALEDLGDDEVE